MADIDNPSFQYPSAVSRTLDPAGRSLKTIVGLHDHQLSDADVNLIQDLQDYKRHLLLADKSATSGCLTYAAMEFTPFIANTFVIPAFDVLFNGEVVSICGFNSPDLTQNRITLTQQPSYWASGYASDDAHIFVIFLEIWYQALDPVLGTGYNLDSSGIRYFYPYGCTVPDPSNAELLPDDSVDVFATSAGLLTTERAQIQWRFNIQPVALTYDFTQFQFGLDPGVRSSEIVYGQGSTTAPIADTIHQFTNMGSINGDTGLWRAGSGENTALSTDSLNTMDGYTYAMPVAVMFQRNSGPFDTVGMSNIFGCGDSSVPNSGLLQTGGISGRFDGKLADQIFPDDVVDTRQTVTLDAWDLGKIMREGFVDLITGNCRTAIGRGDGYGLKTEGLGSTLDYYISVAPSAIPNTNTLLSSWDGFKNGFSSDLRTFYVSKQITTSMKSYWLPSSGGPGSSWVLGDAFTITLPTSVSSATTIQSVTVQSFNVSNNVTTPINLLPGQLQVTGLGTASVTVTIIKNLQGTFFDPGAQNIYCTLGVQYPANSNVDLRKVPIAVDGGSIFDATLGKSLPVYGVSDYAISTNPVAIQAYNTITYNPEYSNLVFGTRISVPVPVSGNSSVVVGATTTTILLNRLGLNTKITGLYPISITDTATTPNVYIPSSISMRGANCTIVLGQAVSSSITFVLTFLAQDTAQLAYNAPVKGVTQIEETVLFGNYTGDSNFSLDSRVSVGSVQFDGTLTTIVLAANNCIIKGISGDDSRRLMWVMDSSGNFNSVGCSTADFNNAMVTVTLVGDYSTSTFFFCGSILPAFDPASTMTIVERYIPYQGEGVLNRNYEVIHNDDNALVTTNGTGAAPLVGLEDVYPYNREFPISTALPALVGWSDATLVNAPLASLFDSNYVAMRQNNVEHTFEVPLHTNDFIPPINKDFRKDIQFISTGGARGFSTAIPHIGFAITAPVARTVLGQNLQATTAPVVLYVNNATGNDANDGLSVATAKLTITAALDALPPVLRHPCSIQLVDTNAPFVIANLQSSLQEIALGDGVIRSSVYYALGNLAFTVQESGRLVITAVAGATNPVVIDATGFAGSGNGPTSAFFIDESRVIFNNLTFQGFINPAIYAMNSDVDFVDCVFTNNLQSGAFSQGCNVIFDGGSITLPDGGTGHVISSSGLTASSVALAVSSGAIPGSFFVGERNSTLNLQTHAVTGAETNIVSSVVVAQVEFNSSVVVTSDFQTNGSAVLSANSTLARTVTISPFLGGVTADSSSNVVTLLS